MSPLVSLAFGVSLRGIRPETLHAIWVAAAVLTAEGFEAVVTSGTEGKHGTGSLHYVGLAADIRIKHVPDERRGFIRDKIKTALGDEYDVIVEKIPLHLHLEYNPKGPLNVL